MAVYIIIGRVSGANALSPDKARARMVRIHAKLNRTKRALENVTPLDLLVAKRAFVFRGSYDNSERAFLNVDARVRGNV